MNETINQLEEIKARFESLYSEKIKKVDTQEIIKKCLQYLNYKNREVSRYTRSDYSEGNTMSPINSMVKNHTNICADNHTEKFNLEGIINFLDKKIRSLKEEVE